MRKFDSNKMRIFNLGKYEACMKMNESGYYDTFIKNVQTGGDVRNGYFLNEKEAYEDILTFFEIFSDDDPKKTLSLVAF